jgi:hypothetical protein
LGLEGLVELLVVQAQGRVEIHLLLEARLEHLFLPVEVVVVESGLLRAIQREVFQGFRRELLDFLEQQEQQEEQQVLVQQPITGQVLVGLEAGHLQQQHLQEGWVEITAYRDCLQQQQGRLEVAQAA